MSPKKGLFEHYGWAAYRNGFGSSKKYNDYWMGLEKMYQLTSTGNWEVFFSFRHKKEGAATFICRNFRVASEMEYYRLNLNSCGSLIAPTKYWRNFPGQMNKLNNAYFSTTDKDSDGNSGSCAASYTAFWYHTSCMGYYPPTGNFWQEATMAIREVKAGEI